MRSLVSGVLFPMMLATPVMAEPRAFSVNDRSGQYLVEVLFPEPPEDPHQLAHAFITIRDNATHEALQQLQTAAGNVPVDRNGKVDNWLLGPQSLLYFDDFNFDGRLDLAIRNGNDPDASYKPAFDVYLQAPQETQWVLNLALTGLAKEDSKGMFSVSPLDGVLLSQTDRDCCWTRATHWKMRGDELVLLYSDTEEQIQPTEPGENTSMPSGYTLRTTGELKDDQWREQSRLEGPEKEDPVILAGTLDAKTPVELWYQVQGTVIIGEVRYTQAGTGEAIKLLGTREDADDDLISLHEYADDGRQTGTWRISRETVEPYPFTGTWVSSAKGDGRQLAVLLNDEERELDGDKIDDVDADQRSGHYQMRQDALGRDADLDLKILPDRDANGKEIAEFTVTTKDSVTEHHIVPMDTENLIIVREPQALEKNGPYHIQLVKGFAVVGYNAVPDSQDGLAGVYLKQR
ncbi:XAC2610-related protein [Pseudomonas kilonensis]